MSVDVGNLRPGARTALPAKYVYLERVTRVGIPANRERQVTLKKDDFTTRHPNKTVTLLVYGFEGKHVVAELGDVGYVGKSDLAVPIISQKHHMKIPVSCNR